MGSVLAKDIETSAGGLLRYWRTTRRLSQLDLALQADVSARHLSYVETGRSQASRGMLLRLSDALEIPLRERNALLVAGGYAARYFDSGLAAPEMSRVRDAIELILKHQEPYPAFVLDRHWEIRQANQAARRCTAFLLDAEPLESNMMRLLLKPGGLRPLLVNWLEIAEDMVRHLHNQVGGSPGDARAKALLAEVLGYPGIPARWQARELGAPATPLLTTHFRKGDRELRFFSTLTRFGTPHDVSLEDVHIECSFPADAATARTCQEVFGR